MEETEDLRRYYEIVEEGIRQAGVDPSLCRSETEGQWNLKRKETELWVDVWTVEQEGSTYFQVMTPLVTPPDTDRETFFRELLELNYQMISACFVSYKEGIYIKITREVEHIIPEEVVVMLNRVAFYGEIFEEGMRKKFNVKKLEHHD